MCLYDLIKHAYIYIYIYMYILWDSSSLITGETLVGDFRLAI